MQILIMAYLIPFSISTAGSIYIGQLLGANKGDQAHNVFKIVLTTCCKKENFKRVIDDQA